MTDETCSGCGASQPLTREFCDECHIRFDRPLSPGSKGATHG